ncbi:MAG TPA: hypothetical protein VM715_13930, partial [Candidatus Acidoferrum sp.]|nr:hypothetical protein [Candidatus Acidoferrum sp.]
MAAVRADLEARSEIPNVERRTDTAGRRQRARKQKQATPRPSASSASTPPSQTRNKAIASFAQLLDQQLEPTLDDLTRMLRGESGRIRKIPISKRI